MNDLIKQVGKGGADFVTADLGFELARRDGVKALVKGFFSKAGDTYVTNVQVLDVSSKRTLASASSSGKGAESILTYQIDDLCGDIFKKLEFTQAQMEKGRAPVSDVATSSLEAYNSYVLGREAASKMQPDVAIRHLEKAIEVDPEFGSAYAELAEEQYYMGDFAKSAEYADKAKRYTDKIAGKERLFADAHFAFLEQNLERWISLAQEIIRNYPK
jgi:tetratricopeptide (TPR) repeat protein